MAAFGRSEIGELIRITSGLHTKMPNHFERNILCQYTDVKYTGLFNNFPAQIAHLHGYCQPFRRFTYLKGSVDNAAVVRLVFRCQNMQTAGQLK